MEVRFEAGNEVIALLGPSGCGKSMTLKCIAGIERPDRGKIVVDDIVLFDSEKRINLTPQERCTGLLFQNYALFPNMTVFQNIRTGAKRKRDTASQERVAKIMASFGLTDYAKHYPSQLSGGQQQRTALARILVSGPHILLLDEPFSALDNHLRFCLEKEMRETIRQFGKTVVLVSHDCDEVFRLADKIAVMSDGKVEVCGRKEDVFANPETCGAAIITGCENISRVRRIDASRVRALDWGVELEAASEAKDAEFIGIRTHDICSGHGRNSFLCDIVEEIENSFTYTLLLRPIDRTNTMPISWEMDKSIWRRLRAEQIEINLPPKAVMLLRG